MTRLGVFGASALALSLAVASPVLAQQQRGGAHPGVRMGSAHIAGAQANFRGPQTNIGGQNFAGRGGNPQFVQHGGQFRGRDRGFGPGAAFAAGAVVGGALAYGASAGYDPYYGGDYAYDNGYAYDSGYDSYAYDNGVTFTAGIPLVTFNQPAAVGQGPVVADASYCAQRYRSYDPASGTYLGYDGLRHPCP